MKNLLRIFVLPALLYSYSASAQSAYNFTQLYFTQGSGTSSLDALKTVAAAGGTVTLLASDAGNFTQPTSIAIDKAGGFIYVGDGGSGTGILRYTLTGGGRTVIVPPTGTSIVGGLALDAGNRKLYFTQGSGTSSLDALKVVNLVDNSVTQLAADAANFTQPTGIALDKTNGFLYVTDGTAPSAGLLRYNLDGTGRTVVVPPVTSAAYFGVVLDVPRNRLYFTQASGTATLDALKPAKLDGSDLVTLAFDVANFTQPYGITLDLAAEQLYIADAGAASQGIIRFNVDGTGRTVIVPPVSGSLYVGIASNESLSTLPLRFSSFTVQPTTAGSVVAWTTEAEQEIVSLTVERSGNGTSFAPLAVLPARNRGAQERYTWTDAAPLPRAYYRVAAVQANGQRFYSAILAVDANQKGNGISVHPNPLSAASFNLTIKLPPGLYTVSLTNSAGQEVLRKNWSHTGGFATQTIDAALLKGVYQLRVYDKEASFSQQLVKP